MYIGVNGELAQSRGGWQRSHDMSHHHDVIRPIENVCKNFERR